MKRTIECPALGCGHRFFDRDRASLIAALHSEAGDVNRHQQSTTTCPECGQSVELGLLVLDEDGVARVSRFAGQASDVTLVRPPGGGVAYHPVGPEQPGRPSAGASAPAELAAGELKLRVRALAVIEGHAAKVSPGAQRDAVELALESTVLSVDEAGRARAWLERRDAR